MPWPASAPEVAAAARPVVLIAAVARNGVLGRNNRMPWHLPGDLAHFRASTLGKPLVLGRRTFESIGRPLPGRFCIVLSRDPAFEATGAETCRTIETALARAQDIADEQEASSVMVGGGAAVYRSAMPFADELLITRIDSAPSGDAYFPTIDPAIWVETVKAPAGHHPEDDAPYEFCRYLRRHAG